MNNECVNGSKAREVLHGSKNTHHEFRTMSSSEIKFLMGIDICKCTGFSIFIIQF